MITRLRRTRILVDGDERLADTLAIEIARGHEVTVLEGANEGLAMIRMRESAKNSRYNLGEALVTEAKAIVEGAIGIGIAVGRRRKLAENLAIIDAACNAGLLVASVMRAANASRAPFMSSPDSLGYHTITSGFAFASATPPANAQTQKISNAIKRMVLLFIVVVLFSEITRRLPGFYDYRPRR